MPITRTSAQGAVILARLAAKTGRTRASIIEEALALLSRGEPVPAPTPTPEFDANMGARGIRVAPSERCICGHSFADHAGYGPTCVKNLGLGGGDICSCERFVLAVSSPEPRPTARVQYRCRDCPDVFTSAVTANIHHDATGHHQTFRCPKCPKALSAHTDAEYAECMGAVASAEPRTEETT